VLAPRRAEYGDRLIVLHHPQSKGMEAASNAGLRASQSDYAVIHDDDDTWHAEFLSECVARLDKESDQIAGVATHSTRVLEDIKEGSIVNQVTMAYNNWLEAISLYQMAASNTFPPISFLFRRRILDELGCFREDLPVLGDWEFHLRVLHKYEIALIPRELANYHFRRDSLNAVYANTVTGAIDKHAYYDARLRNELLREDLQKGRFGIGLLVNVARGFEQIGKEIDRGSAFTFFKDKVYHLAKRARLI
jgi:glycosyltransferase involved in cell wall biosynthesis